MEQYGIPGVGLALLDRGEVVFEGGLGVKTMGKPDPVDADTLFMAASNTKAMTTCCSPGWPTRASCAGTSR
jgi:CubicO group peptidase (beta-lactamase class C family)